MRKDIFSVGALAQDFWVLVLRLFDVPDWMNNNVWMAGKLTLDVTSPYILLSLITALALLIYFSASLGVSTYLSATRSASNGNGEETLRVDVVRLVCVLCLLIASFLLPFLALESGGGYWRTQILAAPFASVLGAMTIEFSFIHLLRYARIPIAARCTTYSATVLAILAVGFVSIAARYQNYNCQWDLIRAPFARLLQTIPAVQNGTVVMLQDVPLTAAPWGSNYWFDILLRLSYPNTKVAGSYSFSLANPQSPTIAPIIKSGGQVVKMPNGKSALAPHGSLYSIDGGRVTLFKTHLPTLISSEDVKDVIALEWTDTGPFKIIRDLSQVELAKSPRTENYDPDVRLNARNASPIALRRFASMLPDGSR